MAERKQWKWADDPSLNKMEFTKLEKDGLDVIETIVNTYSKEGFESIESSDMDRFKWAGVYQQRPKDGHFMMRVRIPGGIMSSEQARVLAKIAQDYGRDLVDVTTRQAVQFHWLTVESLADIFDRLGAAGMSSFEACGDCPRQIMGNPLAGIDPHEVLDTRPIVAELEQFFLLNRDFSNLPRKYKMSVSANIYNAAHAQINDLAFTPAKKVIAGEEVIGFHVWVGGGLSAKPYLAKKLDIFVRPEEVVKVAAGVTTLFRDFGYRQKRTHARLKFLVADWGPEKFKEELVQLVGELEAGGEDLTKGWNGGYFYGLHEQRQPGLYYAGLSVPVGRMNAEELIELARLADEYGDGTIGACNTQNILIRNIAKEKVAAFRQEPLIVNRFKLKPNTFVGYAVSCTGIEYCNLAIVETKERMRGLAQYLDDAVSLDTPLRIHMIGCPNSCGQRQIADIGLQGALVKTPAGMVEAFDVHVGGTLEEPQFNRKLNARVTVDRLGAFLAQLIALYKEDRLEGEEYWRYVERVGLARIQEQVDSILQTA
ncbi:MULTISPECIES: nitrite/sulfite reductase [Brevibacillus]|uniref:nitrite/sulfite reductase n=1 Tax=Brevibacillus TaxID=55080 RepID=UPI000EE673B3|nr:MULTISPECIES: nitrite/sulfite reductase [Brevibacillus]MBU8714445.1 nitrite/sulfite reductase [Brevibacillus parabrevis]MDR4998714.1 nitrite/sulfite reductase [Brevibacillus parabrevis]NRQ54406.1 nitrite/sulfite reductase [Brevibacillus sp. HD1.4A]WDV93909.1 nitrite/sulfite reductase [Brevibacillus parabrevis]HBZ80740.1 ferredoxin--nitrite reductase [Brevibacillus sp.]